MNDFSRCVVALAIVLLGASSSYAQEAYQIIVNGSNPIESLTKADAARLFLSRATWNGGDPVFPVDLAPTSPIRQEFSRDVLGMTPSAAFEQRKRAAGDSSPTVASDREVLAYVRLKRGGIGYVSAGANLMGVKVIAIVKK